MFPTSSYGLQLRPVDQWRRGARVRKVELIRFPGHLTEQVSSGVRNMAKQWKQYTEEFKRDAVRMMKNRGEPTVAQVADDLGVNANQLHRWAAKKEHEAGKPTPERRAMASIWAC